MTRMIKEAGSQYSQFDYVTALQEMHDIGRAMGRFMADYDVILPPINANSDAGG